MSPQWQCEKCGGTERYTHRYGKCKVCMRAKAKAWAQRFPERIQERDLRKKYGLTLNDVREMLRRQSGRCAICRTDTPGGKHNRFNVDHCHRTGRVRGLLCDPCNRGIGFLKESSERLITAAIYLDGAK